MPHVPPLEGSGLQQQLLCTGEPRTVAGPKSKRCPRACPADHPQLFTRWGDKSWAGDCLLMGVSPKTAPAMERRAREHKRRNEAVGVQAGPCSERSPKKHWGGLLSSLMAGPWGSSTSDYSWAGSICSPWECQLLNCCFTEHELCYSNVAATGTHSPLSKPLDSMNATRLM